MNYIIKNKLIVVFIGILFAIIYILNIHSVDTAVTDEDIVYINKLMPELNRLPSEANYEEQLEFILAVQKAVFDVSPVSVGISKNRQRELKDLHQLGKGACFDRSRSIEKILRYFGFNIRHLSLYSIEKTNSKIRSLLTRNVISHSVTEVETKRGWLIVDSYDYWVALDSDRNPVSIQDIQDSNNGLIEINWLQRPLNTVVWDGRFTFLYGVYSRHGHFYPPYNFIPDINYREFYLNLS